MTDATTEGNTQPADRPTNAADLPDGTEVLYDGDVWTAYPPMPWNPLIRWHCDDLTATNGLVTGMLADDAEVLGVNQAKLDEYNALVFGARSGRGE
jgi:hypothetical protein